MKAGALGPILDCRKSLRESAEAARRVVLDREQKNNAIFTLLFEFLEGAPRGSYSENVHCYVSTGAEVDTRQIIARLLEAGKKVFVPLMGRGSRVTQIQILGMHELIPGKMGILEPKPEIVATQGRHVEAREVGLYLVPGVAFDRFGYRLGYGKGFYDRLLAQVNPSATKVGLCFSAQVVDSIPRFEHDIPVDVLVTEEQALRV